MNNNKLTFNITRMICKLETTLYIYVMTDDRGLKWYKRLNSREKTKGRNSNCLHGRCLHTRQHSYRNYTNFMLAERVIIVSSRSVEFVCQLF